MVEILIKHLNTAKRSIRLNFMIFFRNCLRNSWIIFRLFCAKSNLSDSRSIKKKQKFMDGFLQIFFCEDSNGVTLGELHDKIANRFYFFGRYLRNGKKLPIKAWSKSQMVFRYNFRKVFRNIWDTHGIVSAETFLWCYSFEIYFWK